MRESRVGVRDKQAVACLTMNSRYTADGRARIALVDEIFTHAAICYAFELQNFLPRDCYAFAVVAMGLCPSVCLPVTSRSCTKTVTRRITKTTLHDSPGTLVFWRQRSPRNSTAVTPYKDAKCRWGGSKLATFDK